MANIKALQWIAWAGRQSVEQVEALGLTDEQAKTLGQWFQNNKILSPAKRSKPRKREGLFICACGCEETFRATWTTRLPRYKNRAHKARAQRRRAASGLNLPTERVKIALSAVDGYTKAIIGKAKQDYLIWYRYANDAQYRSDAARIAANTRWNYWEKLRQMQLDERKPRRRASIANDDDGDGEGY